MALLKKQQVLESYHELISQGQGEAENTFDEIITQITDNQVPVIKMSKESAALSLMGKLFGRKREFIIVTNTTNKRLKAYRIYVNARDYGTNLQVSWYLVSKVGFCRALLAIIFRGVSSGETLVMKLDLFDLQDLQAFRTVVHRAVLHAVRELVKKLGQDPSAINQKSKGYLDRW